MCYNLWCKDIFCFPDILYVYRLQLGGGRMATSSFGKQFAVRYDKATEFVEEMTKAVTPTLRSDFHSQLTYLSQDQD